MRAAQAKIAKTKEMKGVFSRMERVSCFEYINSLYALIKDSLSTTGNKKWRRVKKASTFTLIIQAETTFNNRMSYIPACLPDPSQDIRLGLLREGRLNSQNIQKLGNKVCLHLARVNEGPLLQEKLD